MEYNLENKVLLSEDSEYKSLYPWSLQELDKDHKKIGRDLIPWRWSLYFTASELRLFYDFDISKSCESENKVTGLDCEIIVGILHPGICRDGKTLEDDITYSMFGTNREIRDFKLRITSLQEKNENEQCLISGAVSNTFELDFENITDDDCVEISVVLEFKRFIKLVELIKNQQIDNLELRLSKVSGVYSDWSPSIKTGYLKVLTEGDGHVIIKSDGCEIDPPRLGDVGEFNLSITQRHKLNLKQDLRSIDAGKLFGEPEEPEDESMDDSEPQESPHDKMLSQLSRNELALNKIRTVLWLILIVLSIYVLNR